MNRASDREPRSSTISTRRSPAQRPRELPMPGRLSLSTAGFRRLPHALEAQMNALIRRVAPALVVLPLGGQVLAQAPATPPAMTFEQAVQYALAHHPAVAGAAARIDAARASRDLAAAGRVPSLDAEALLSGATGNVVAGSFLPLVGVPGSSGPVGTTGLGGGAWTTTAALVSTTPLPRLPRAHTPTHPPPPTARGARRAHRAHVAADRGRARRGIGRRRDATRRRVRSRGSLPAHDGRRGRAARNAGGRAAGAHAPQQHRRARHAAASSGRRPR